MKYESLLKDPVVRIQERSEPAANGCVEFMGSRSKGGYGQMSINGKRTYVHRFVYELYKGSAKGLLVRHTCDNPPCCNPDHLLAGTAKDNAQDRVQRGRNGKRGPNRRKPVYKPGYKPGRSNRKLTIEQVREIRIRWTAGERVVQMASEYGVARATIYHVTQGRNWADEV